MTATELKVWGMQPFKGKASGIIDAYAKIAGDYL